MALKKIKKVKTHVKLNLKAGQATPAPPVGPALGQHGVAIMEFCKEFNAKTAKLGDFIIPVDITVYEDRSFSFITKTPLTSFLILKAINVQKGSGKPNTDKVGTISRQDIESIAKTKMPDLNTKDLARAVKVVSGTARSMGVEIK